MKFLAFLFVLFFVNAYALENHHDYDLEQLSLRLPDAVPAWVYTAARTFITGFVNGYDLHFGHPTQSCMDADFMDLFDDFYYYAFKSPSKAPLKTSDTTFTTWGQALKAKGAGTSKLIVLFLSELLNDCQAINVLNLKRQ